ncbi:MAG TPA: hypothetical protein VE175_13730 [Woeseiaceae bacterium]|nr:hypothetical protein [Woeseiaceae bacterium]
MKPNLLLLLTVLFPFAALAEDKDPRLGDTYRVAKLECTSGTFAACQVTTNPTTHPYLAVAKRIHSATIRLLADPGHTCSARLTMLGAPPGSLITDEDILQVFATEQTPGALTVAFPQPILMDSDDQFNLEVSELVLSTSGCHARATVGVELLTKIDDVVLR